VDYESQVIKLHIIGRGFKEFKVSDLTDDELRDLWFNAQNDTARYALRERTGMDPTWTTSNMTKEDFQWYVGWKERQKAKQDLEGEA
jgi:beta-lactamase class D